MRMTFDRGTIRLEDAPPGVDAADFPGFSWDARAGALCGPARLAYALAAALRRRALPLTDLPRPALAPPSGVRPVSLQTHQHAALRAWRRAGRRGLVVMPPGAGKTRVALAAVAQTRAACLVLTPTRGRLAQWAAVLAEIHDGPIGRFGAGERALEPITVATFAAAQRSMPVIGDRFGMLVVDEAGGVGAGGVDGALEMSIAPVRLGLAAAPPTPGPVAARVGALVGPTVFELRLGDVAGRAPIEHVTWRLTLDDGERREYEALVAVYGAAARAVLGTRAGASWHDFAREAARTEEGRRGLAAWRRAARLLAAPRATGDALATLLARHRAERTLVLVGDAEAAQALAREHFVTPLPPELADEERRTRLARFRDGTLRALVLAPPFAGPAAALEAEVAIVLVHGALAREATSFAAAALRSRPEACARLYRVSVTAGGDVPTAEQTTQRADVARPAA